MGSINTNVQWPGWETVRLIGRGSFATVYEIERDVFGHKEKAALKAITIPQNDNDIEELYDSGYDEASVTATFKSHMESIVNEYSIMREMTGSANVVSCDDFRIVPHDDNIGWDIFIKMELLTPLTKALGKQPDDEQAIQIAKDICNALILCKKYGIVHRDIKPQNIFISKNGDYKLGDFGIAKTIEKTSGGTKIGTYKYMAPEVYNNQPYNHTADIYSLGLVLYWILNERRLPFMPLPPTPAVASQEEDARAKRFGGMPIPAPAHGSEKLKQIVLRACAFDPKDRYQSASEMLHDLNMLSTSAKTIYSSVSSIVKEHSQPITEINDEVAANAAINDESSTEGTIGVWSAANRIASSDNGSINVTEDVQTEEDTLTEGRTIGVWDHVANEPQKPQSQPIPERTYERAQSHVLSNIIKRPWIYVAAAAVVLIVAVIAIFSKKPIVDTTKEPAYNTLQSTISAGRDHTVGLRTDGTVIAVGSNTFGQCDVSSWRDIVAVSAGGCHTIGLKSDGTVVVVGWNEYDQCEVSEWRDIVAVSAGDFHTIGLKSDGTVVAVGSNYDGECDVSSWRDIVAVSAGGCHTIGLKSDGTVVVVGWNQYDQCEVSEWRDIVAVSAGDFHTVGLKSDGTVVAIGWNEDGQCDVKNWKGIVAIAAGGDHTVGLKADGTVLAVGRNYSGQCAVGTWKDIIAIAAGNFHTVGLKSDGTAVAVGYAADGQCDVSNWNGIVDIAAGVKHTVGLEADGSVITAGCNGSGRCDVSDFYSGNNSQMHNTAVKK